MRKLVFIGIATWLLLISVIELFMVFKLNYITVPIIVTCVIGLVICVTWLIHCSDVYCALKREEERRKKQCT